MNDASLEFPRYAIADSKADAQVEASACTLGFGLFLVLTAIIFVRPTDLVPELQGLPIYECVILLCAVASIPSLINQLRWRTIVAQPWTLCVIGLLPAIMLADLAHGNIYGARTNGFDFLKNLIYYLLLVGLVESPERLRKFLIAVAQLVTLLAALALLEYHEIINIPALAPMIEGAGEDAGTGEATAIIRLMGTGVFQDPNDFSLILGASILIGLYWIFEQKNWFLRCLWMSAIAVLTYAFTLTRSRGGFLALMAGLVVLLISRVGWRRSLPIGAVLFPLVLILFGGRQTSIDIADANDTGQGRILLWRDSLMLFRTAPMFGIGVGQLAEANDYVAHNSYIHAFTELGIVGGILFIGTWYVLFVAMPKTIECRASDTAAELIRWKPYVLGMMTTYAAGLFSLTRCYALPTYLVLGCTGAYVRLVSIHVSPNPIRLNGLLCRRLVMAGIGSLVFLYVFVKVFAR